MKKKVFSKLRQEVKVKVESLVMISKFITLGNSRISLLGDLWLFPQCFFFISGAKSKNNFRGYVAFKGNTHKLVYTKKGLTHQTTNFWT